MKNFLNMIKEKCSYSFNIKSSKYIETDANGDFTNIEIKYYLTLHGTEFESDYIYDNNNLTYQDKIDVLDNLILNLNNWDGYPVFFTVKKELEEIKNIVLFKEKLEIKLPEKNIKTKVKKI